MMGHKVSAEELEHYTNLALQRGGTVNGKGPAKTEPANLQGHSATPALVDSSVALVDYGQTLVILLGVETASEVNKRDWKARSRRSGKAWKAASKAMGPHLAMLAPFAEAYHAGTPLKVVLTRLGGKRRLDKSNLPTALKACEDWLACVCGADDGDDRWCPEWGQELGGPVGVRIELSVKE